MDGLTFSAMAVTGESVLFIISICFTGWPPFRRFCSSEALAIAGAQIGTMNQPAHLNNWTAATIRSGMIISWVCLFVVFVFRIKRGCFQIIVLIRLLSVIITVIRVQFFLFVFGISLPGIPVCVVWIIWFKIIHDNLSFPYCYCLYQNVSVNDYITFISYYIFILTLIFYRSMNNLWIVSVIQWLLTLLDRIVLIFGSVHPAVGCAFLRRVILTSSAY